MCGSISGSSTQFYCFMSVLCQYHAGFVIMTYCLSYRYETSYSFTKGSISHKLKADVIERG